MTTLQPCWTYTVYFRAETGVYMAMVRAAKDNTNKAGTLTIVTNDTMTVYPAKASEKDKYKKRGQAVGLEQHLHAACIYSDGRLEPLKDERPSNERTTRSVVSLPDPSRDLKDGETCICISPAPAADLDPTSLSRMSSSSSSAGAGKQQAHTPGYLVQVETLGGKQRDRQSWLLLQENGWYKLTIASRTPLPIQQSNAPLALPMPSSPTAAASSSSSSSSSSAQTQGQGRVKLEPISPSNANTNANTGSAPMDLDGLPAGAVLAAPGFPGGFGALGGLVGAGALGNLGNLGNSGDSAMNKRGPLSPLGGLGLGALGLGLTAAASTGMGMGIGLGGLQLPMQPIRVDVHVYFAFGKSIQGDTQPKSVFSKALMQNDSATARSLKPSSSIKYLQGVAGCARALSCHSAS